MKKPGQRRSVRERAEHRNPQLPRLKRASVHPVTDQPPESGAIRARKGNPRRKLKDGQPNSHSKLTTKLSEQICGCVRLGMSWQEAAMVVGVHRNAITAWKAKGEANPQSAYGAFLRAAERAELSREVVHLKFISEDLDWKARRWLLCNFRPEKYRMTSFSGELVGKDGAPLFSNDFSVLIELAAQPEERPFVVEHMGGEHDGERKNWQPNGEKLAPKS